MPSARTAVGIYVAVLALATVPELTTKAYSSSTWAGIWWSLPMSLVAVALFVAALAIDDRWAFAVPAVALTVQTMLVHEFGVHSDVGQGMWHVTLRHDLWEMIRFELPVALIVVGAAFWLGQLFEPWVSEDRIELPPIKWPAIILVASLAAYFALQLALRHIDFLSELLMVQVAGVVGAATTISFFVLCAVAYSPWVLPLPIFLTGEATLEMLTNAGFSCDEACREFLWPAIRTNLVIWTAVMLIALACGWWARRDDAEPQSDLEPRAEDHGALAG